MFAAIDVGSNTVRMLLGDVHRGRVIPMSYSREITRLKGGQSDAGLTSDAMDRTLAALQRFHAKSLLYPIESMMVVGTEALRSAANSEQFIERLRKQTGLSINVLSGEEEARYSATGALSVIDPRPAHSVILDIGGGSTEIVVTCGENILFSHSCPLGVVRLAEVEGREAADFIESNLESLGALLEERGLLDKARRTSTVLVGTAGTITTLAAIDLGMAEYDWRRVNNHRLSAATIDNISDRLAPLSVHERELQPGMESGRGDLILPGLLVLKGLLNQFAKNELIVSDFGLLEGLLLQMSIVAAIH